MTTLTDADKIDDPVIPQVRPEGLLLQVADDLNVAWADPATPGDGSNVGLAPQSPMGRGVRWMAGVRFVGYDATNIPVTFPLDWCDIDDLGLRTAPDSQMPVFEAIPVWDGESCSSLAVEYPWLTARTNHRVDLWASFLLAQELLTGTVTGNPSLQSTATTVPGGPFPAPLALVRLEAAISAAFGNTRMIVHMPPALLPLLNIYLDDDDNSAPDVGYNTPSGHRVIFDAGYSNIAPGGAAGDNDSLWMYASGPVACAVSDIKANDLDGSINYARNELNARSHAYAIAVFDPDSVLAVEVDISPEGFAGGSKSEPDLADAVGFGHATISTSVGLPSLPATAKRAVVNIAAGTVNYRADGATTAPTSTVGMPLASGSTTEFGSGHAALAALRFVSSSGTPVLSVTYFS